MESTAAPAAVPVFRRVVRKGPHLITCNACHERKHAYVMGTGDICNACRSRAVLAHHSDR